MNIFEKASRLKLRFMYVSPKGPNGPRTAEEIWDLPVNELDNMYKDLKRKQRSTQEEGLLGVKSSQDMVLSLKIEIIEHVVKTKLNEKELRANKVKISQERQRILTLLAEKEDEALGQKSVDELKSMLAELE